ncbi:T9SS type A sorting domain-containing protein [Marixanthomonas sp. SCSIO 43207]|uniref:T9SS type A sorting domain-containing protein n=1 Tax=Marixanthomonas sp. SCSIO 43207 TaxID=2779360 RepID=UPI001CA870AD|nr:T9SS type A sorting domain-containing protein [Marixanthomonas sp. SCSIO 43207]UAB80943.1 T9SS type A sorting domain-containing protein [Marixanthomonas sp. SCSIO 43207]
MKKLLHIAAFLAVGFSTTAQETVELSMGANYENEVYLKLANETQNTYAANSWDIAFLRNSPQNIGIRVNDGIGIQVFEAADDPAEWNNINVANESSWTALYNDDTNWDNGAFMQGSASYGWGEYNPVTHHVEGTIIFVLKYADGTYRKFINEDFFGGYTFKFATWDGNDWVNEKTVTVDNNDNPANRYNYYSLQNDETVIAEPAVGDWDMVFRKYVTDLGGGTYYNVTGVLHNPNVTVAQNEELDGEGDPNGLSYSEDINTIGYDWKSFDGSGYTVNSDMAYYVKYDESTIYRLVFTEFDGASTGNIELDYQDVSGLLGFEDVTEDISFGMYPNPTTNGQVSIVYDVANTASAKNTIEVFAINGAKVYSETMSSTSGFYNKTLDLSALQSGVYMVNVTSGKNTITKKLILK